MFLDADGAVEPGESGPKASDPAGGGHPLGNPGIVVEDPVQGDLHLRERRGGLHQGAEGHFAGEEIGRFEQQRHDGGDGPVAAHEPHHSRPLLEHAHPTLDQGVQRLVERFDLVGLAADQGDTLGVLAHPTHLGPQFGLGGVLFLDAVDQRTAEDEHRTGHHAGIQDRGKNHEAGDGGAEHLDIAAHRPEHDEEDEGGENGIEDAGAELDDGFGRNAGVFGNAELGGIEVGGGDAQAVEALVVEPLLGQAFGQPLAPINLQLHA